MSELDDLLKRSSQPTRRDLKTMVRHRMSDAGAGPIESLSEDERVIPSVLYQQTYDRLLIKNPEAAKRFYELVAFAPIIGKSPMLIKAEAQHRQILKILDSKREPIRPFKRRV